MFGFPETDNILGEIHLGLVKGLGRGRRNQHFEYQMCFKLYADLVHANSLLDFADLIEDLMRDNAISDSDSFNHADAIR